MAEPIPATPTDVEILAREIHETDRGQYFFVEFHDLPEDRRDHHLQVARHLLDKFVITVKL